MNRIVLPPRRPCVTLKVRWAGHSVHISAGFDPTTGALAEVFAGDGVKSGTDLRHTLADACIWLSLALQYGIPLGALGRSLTRDEAGAPASLLGAIVEALAVLEVEMAGAPREKGRPA